jgi:hypothetical protein
MTPEVLNRLHITLSNQRLRRMQLSKSMLETPVDHTVQGVLTSAPLVRPL